MQPKDAKRNDENTVKLSITENKGKIGLIWLFYL